MYLIITLPQVDSGVSERPLACPYEDCQGGRFRLHQRLERPILDTQLDSVTVSRYRCLACNRTFRVHPTGVTQAQASQRVAALATLLYTLGLSYDSVSSTLGSLGIYLCKSGVYEIVQTVLSTVPPLPRECVFEDIRIPEAKGGMIGIRRGSEWIQMRLSRADGSSLVLIVDALGESAYQLQDQVAPIVKAIRATLELVNG